MTASSTGDLKQDAQVQPPVPQAGQPEDMLRPRDRAAHFSSTYQQVVWWKGSGLLPLGVEFVDFSQ
jgi:hypothetical protein